MNREHDGIADWVINELCDELECDGDEIVDRVKSLKQTIVKMSEAAGETHRRVQEMEEGIERVLPDHKLLSDLLPPGRITHTPGCMGAYCQSNNEQLLSRNAAGEILCQSCSDRDAAIDARLRPHHPHPR